jgi:hypothetical protein
MRRPSSGLRLSNAQVAELESRRKTLGLTRATFLRKFESALRDAGCIHTDAAVKMRLNRVFNPRMRRPMSEETEIALAVALDWNLSQLEHAIGIASEVMGKQKVMEKKPSHRLMAKMTRELADAAVRLQQIARTLQDSLQGRPEADSLPSRHAQSRI